MLVACLLVLVNCRPVDFHTAAPPCSWRPLRGLGLQETLSQFSHTMTAQCDLRVEVRADHISVGTRGCRGVFRESVRPPYRVLLLIATDNSPAVQAVHLERFHQNFAMVASQVGNRHIHIYRYNRY